MRQPAQHPVLILAVCLIPALSAFADRDKDDKDKKVRQSESFTVLRTSDSGPDPGQCTLGVAQKDLDVNNVRARLFNIGTIGYRQGFGAGGHDAQYIVPKASGHSAIYATAIWIGGMVGDELRTVGAQYTNFEFWPGPLGSDGRPVNPNDCSAYDRLYKVSRSDIQSYEATGQVSADLADWPYDLGAPIIDGDGTEGNYNLAGGDRPDLIGDQAVWWIMNDVGNTHNATESPPIGVEVRVHAFAFNRADALGETTFFKYNVAYKGSEPLTDAYFSIWSDPDLGISYDDFVGADTTLGLGYVYNDNAVDNVYGPAPAVGFDFLQGPISEDGDTLSTTSINRIVKSLWEPRFSHEVYNVQQGLWIDGQPITASGQGYQTDGPITKFTFPGDPVTGAFWSEVNNDGNGSRNQSGDRRFAMSTGPFTMQPGDSQDIVFAIVFAQSTDNLSSITALRDAAALAQAAFDAGFSSSPFATGIERTTNDASILEASVDDIGIVPNPYRGRSAYETGNEDRRARFTNLPQTATIQIYTVRGTLIRTLYKDGPSTSLDWNLTTDSNLPVASGMYFIHIDVPGVGEKVMKFGVINRGIDLSLY